MQKHTNNIILIRPYGQECMLLFKNKGKIMF